jgi:hypothetical protein
MTNRFEELQAQLWVFAALGRLAALDLLETPASEPIDVASQRLLIETGWLDAEPIGPSAAFRSVLPPGAPLKAGAAYVNQMLDLILRYANGAPAGWQQDNPGLIRSWGAASGGIVQGLFGVAFPELPGFPERLQTEGAAFLDVGMGGGGVSIAMCREFPGLRAVGLDVSEAAIAVASEDIAAAGLADRIEARLQSVTDIADTQTFDLIWLPQPFLPPTVLSAALPRLFRAARPAAALVMPLAVNAGVGLVGAAADVRHAMVGGGSTTADTCQKLLQEAGFTEVRALDTPGGTMMLARRQS